MTKTTTSSIPSSSSQALSRQSPAGSETKNVPHNQSESERVRPSRIPIIVFLSLPWLLLGHRVWTTTEHYRQWKQRYFASWNQLETFVLVNDVLGQSPQATVPNANTVVAAWEKDLLVPTTMHTPTPSPNATQIIDSYRRTCFTNPQQLRRAIRHVLELPLDENPFKDWCTREITDLSGVFQDLSTFNFDVNTWNTSRVVSLVDVFRNAHAFNQPLDKWDVSKVVSLDDAFSHAHAFNQPLATWNVARVVSMEGTFAYAYEFHQPLGTWNVSKVETMAWMFREARNYNDPTIGRQWNVAHVLSFERMFANATRFVQDLCPWTRPWRRQLQNHYRAYSPLLVHDMLSGSSCPAGFVTHTNDRYACLPCR